VKIPTTLVINGDVTVYANEDEIRVTGYQFIPASAHRKQAFSTHSDTLLTMVFPTNAATIEEAEDEFTEEAALLMSRGSDAKNFINITGE
jgi:formylmethanofuran dehydrogenase subunit D